MQRKGRRAIMAAMDSIFRSVRIWYAAAGAAAALGFVSGLAGCGDTETTPASKAKVDLNPGGRYEVVSFTGLAEAAGEGEGEEGAAAPSVLTVTGSPRDGGGWDLTLATDGGLHYPAVADAGTASEPTGGGKTYEAGAQVAEYALSGEGVSGRIAVFATAAIPLEIRRATNAPAAGGATNAASTNAAATNAAVGMHGVHRISPDNARCELDATLQGLSATLKAKASAGSGEITW